MSLAEQKMVPWRRILATAAALLSGLPLAATPLTSAEVNQIESELGITLSEAQKTALAAAVKPDTVETWRTEAEARIETHRRADLIVQALDRNGDPLPGAEVEVRLRHKAFHFGGVLDLKQFAGATPLGISTNRYKELALALFDTVGLNNGLKPKLRAGNEAYLPGFFAWCAANGIESRGHLLIWPGNPSNNHLPSDLRALVDQYNATSDPTARETLKGELEAAVDAMITEWAGLWPVYEWDVINEPVSNYEVQEILGYDRMAKWFQLARDHAVRPDCGLLLNDFQIISAPSTGTTYSRRSTDFKWNLDRIIADGGPVTGLGFQSRYKFERMDPNVLYARLEEFAAYGLPMAGTEFHVPDREGDFEPSEALRAQITEEVMTIYFSHPLVSALNCWAFIDDRPEQAPLLDENGSFNLQGLVWYYLNRIRYATHETVPTAADGRASLRGFKGEYEVVVRFAGQEQSLPLSLRENSEIPLATDLAPDTDGDGTHDDADLDDDGDFLPDAFETAHGFDPLKAGEGSVDQDWDGRKTLLEFAQGTNPIVADADPATPWFSLVKTSTAIELRYQHRAGLEALGLHLALAHSPDLLNWDTLAAPEDFAAAGFAIVSAESGSFADAFGSIRWDRFELAPASAAGFFRVEIETD